MERRCSDIKAVFGAMPDATCTARLLPHLEQQVTRSIAARQNNDFMSCLIMQRRQAFSPVWPRVLTNRVSEHCHKSEGSLVTEAG